MMNCRFASFLFVALLVGLSTSAFAQSANAIKTVTKEEVQQDFDQFRWVSSQDSDIHEIHFVGGYSFHSTRGFWGKIPEADMQVLGLRYNRKILHIQNQHLLEYVTELNISVDYNLSPTRFNYGNGSFSGFGVTPLGFQFNWQKENIVQPFFKTSTGFMYFKKSFPDDRGTKFNFTLELGAGLEFTVTQNLSFTLGYKYHHMSNFFLGSINPGVDSNIFYTGITIF